VKTITTEGEAHAAILDMLLTRAQTSKWRVYIPGLSAGDMTRKMMGVGMLKNEEWSYVLVREALHSLHARGLVGNAGNGRRVTWFISREFWERFGGLR